MRHALLTSIALFIAAASPVHANDAEPFAPNVDTQTGAIRVPASYVEWPTLGTWAHAHTGAVLEEKGPGIHEYHVVYTQAATLKHYRATGEFPDGAVLVKELLHAETQAASG